MMSVLVERKIGDITLLLDDIFLERKKERMVVIGFVIIVKQ